MGKARRKKNEDSLLLALACGASVETAAKQCDICERSVYRRLEEPAFNARLQELRSDMVKRAAGMLTAAATEAVRTLLSLQKESAPPAVRLGAARAILELGIKVREMAEFETRLAKMEATLRQQGQPGNQGRSWQWRTDS